MLSTFAESHQLFKDPAVSQTPNILDVLKLFSKWSWSNCCFSNLQASGKRKEESTQWTRRCEIKSKWWATLAFELTTSQHLIKTAWLLPDLALGSASAKQEVFLLPLGAITFGSTACSSPSLLVSVGDVQSAVLGTCPFPPRSLSRWSHPFL